MSSSTTTSSARLSDSAWASVVSRIVVWGSFFLVLYMLRSFFLLVFLTFVFAYIQEHGVELLEKRLRIRALCVLLVGLSFLGVLIGIGAYIIPNVVEQAKGFADRIPEYIAASDEALLSLADDYPLVSDYLSPGGAIGVPTDEKTGITAKLIQSFVGEPTSEAPGNHLAELAILIRNIGQFLLGVGSAFFLALLFSILIVFDLPRLSRGIESLRRTRARWVYEEVSQSIRDFGQVLGRALEAQLVIAIINTGLTAIVIQILGVGDKTAFLSLVVFLCSFIPVAGVFISSIPICIAVLPISGIPGVILAIGLIWVIHMIEAYVLNPRIFGHHLHINPVLVLIILTISGKLFHVWGLVLSLPICTYVYEYALRPEGLEHKAILKKRHIEKSG